MSVNDHSDSVQVDDRGTSRHGGIASVKYGRVKHDPQSGALQAHGFHRFAHEAMATTFELFIADTDQDNARHAAHEAFSLVDRLESLLSRFSQCSDIAQVNRLLPGMWCAWSW